MSTTELIFESYEKKKKEKKDKKVKTENKK